MFVIKYQGNISLVKGYLEDNKVLPCDCTTANKIVIASYQTEQVNYWWR